MQIRGIDILQCMYFKRWNCDQQSNKKWFFEENVDITLIRRERKRDQITDARIERGDITTDFTDIKKIIRYSMEILMLINGNFRLNGHILKIYMYTYTYKNWHKKK